MRVQSRYGGVGWRWEKGHKENNIQSKKKKKERKKKNKTEQKHKKLTP